MKKICAICATAIGVALLATPAIAGGDWRNDGCPYCGPGGWNGNGYYGRLPNGHYGHFATPYGYINGNGGHYAPPPPPPSVAVEPFACERHEMIFIPRFNRWACKPVRVPRLP